MISHVCVTSRIFCLRLPSLCHAIPCTIATSFLVVTLASLYPCRDRVRAWQAWSCDQAQQTSYQVPAQDLSCCPPVSLAQLNMELSEQQQAGRVPHASWGPTPPLPPPSPPHPLAPFNNAPPSCSPLPLSPFTAFPTPPPLPLSLSFSPSPMQLGSSLLAWSKVKAASCLSMPDAL